MIQSIIFDGENNNNTVLELLSKMQIKINVRIRMNLFYDSFFTFGGYTYIRRNLIDGAHCLPFSIRNNAKTIVSYLLCKNIKNNYVIHEH